MIFFIFFTKPKLFIKTCLAVFFTVFIVPVNAQTGPGGVGNTDGINGQPKNVLWLDASTLGYSDGADLSSWSDISGNGNDLDQPNASYTPIFRNNGANVNGHPRAEFSKVDNRIVINPFSDMPTSGISSFIVYNTSDNGDALLSYNTAGRDNAFLLFDNSALRTYVNGGVDFSAIAFNSGNWQIMSHKWQSSGGDLTMHLDGDAVYSKTFQSGVSIPSGGSFAIGGEQDSPDGGYDPNQDFDGDIAEVIMYNSFLNSAQQILVENYLSEKYAIAFATAGNDKYTGNDITYVYNIAGIGQEADGSHTQASSGGLYVYEWNSSLANGEYVMMGHDNTSNNSTTIRTDIEITTSGAEAAWARDWYLEKTSSDGIDSKIIFDFREALSDGEYPDNVANYILLYRVGTSGNYTLVTNAGQGIYDADQVYFDVADANLLNGYYTIGSSDTLNSPIEGTSGRTWYALASGDWDTWDFWTLDPSGALPNNPAHETPASSDKVVIHTGKTITLNTNTKTLAAITVDGILQLGTTSGHNFTEINGSGRIRLASDNFPLGDATHFTSAGQGEGTVVWQGGSYSLSTEHTFYKMEVDLDNAANILTLIADYTLKGELVVETGALQINDNSATTNLNIEVQGNVTVELAGQLLTGTGNARHQLDLYGNFTNKGTAEFTNRSAAVYNSQATDGIVDANFLNNTANQTVLCNGPTTFYRIEIDKGTDDTYILDIQSNLAANFNLFGFANESHGGVAQLTTNANAIGLLRGTVKIGANVNIPRLSNTASNYNISEAARLWVAGGTVQKNTGNAIVPYGIIQISDGLLEARVSSGITTRDNGLIKVEGGIVNTNVIRTSVMGASNVGGYVQSDGTVNIINPGGSSNDYYHFCLTYPGNTFSMSGGTLHVYDANADALQMGGIFIASDPENINVTGGTVIAEIASTTNPFKITSTAPFYNLILRNTNNAVTDHILDAGAGVGSTNENLAAQPLVVLNDLTIEDNCFLDHNGQDITVGAGFSISANSQQQGTNNYGLLYDAALPNTLSFNGNTSDTLYIGHAPAVSDGYEMYVWNLIVNKTNSAEIVLKGDPIKEPANVSTEWHNRLVNVQGTIDVKNGTFNQGLQSIRLYGPVKVRSNGVLGVYIPGTTNLTAYIMLKDNDTELQTENGAELGNFKLNPQGAAVVSLGSDIYIKRIGFHSGLLNLKSYKLKIDYLHRNATLTNFAYTNGSTTKMIFSDGNASDGGIELYIPGGISSDTDFGFPLGTTTGITRYTPVRVRITSSSDDGYIQIRPVDGELKTTNLSGGNLLSYYWRVGHSDFTGLPTVRYRFVYDDSDDDAGDEANFVQGKVLDENPYTRSSPAGGINTTNNRLNYNVTTLERANYTAGRAARFTGTVPVFHSVANVRRRWNNTNAWQEGAVPTEGSIVIITNASIVDVHGVEPSTAIPAETNLTTSSSRVQFYRNTSTYNLGIVQGYGMISFNMDYDPTVLGDFGEFASNSTSLYLFFIGDGHSHTMNHIPQPAPTINFESGHYTLNQPDLVVNFDLVSGWNNYDLIIADDILVKRNLRLSDYDRGALHFPATGNAVTLTVEGNVVVGDPIVVDNPGVASTLEHKFIVGGDITISEDNIDLFNTPNRTTVVLEINGESNNSFSSSSATTSDFYRVVLNKGSSQTNSFTFIDNFTLSGATSGVGVSKALELQNGTLILDDNAISINLTTGDDDFTIPTTGALEVRQGQVFANGNSGIILDGKLLVSGGTVDMSGGDNYIQYSASGSAELEVTGGTLTVGSQIRRGLTSTEGILAYNQSGGSVIVGNNTAPEGNRGVFEILNSGSSFTHSGGSLTLVRQQTNPSFAALYLDPETSNISVGTTITLGNGSTPANQEFGIYSTINLQNLTLNTTNSPKAKMWTVPLTINGELTIESGTEFNANGLDLNLYGDFTNSGTFSANSNTTYFKASSNQQIDGNSTFYNLTSQNTANLNLATGNADIIIDNILSLENGILNDNSNDISVYGNLYNSVTYVYGGSGDGISMLGGSEQVITGSGTYGKISINNANGITLPVGNTPTIRDFLKLESGVLNIGGNLLTLGKNCVIQEANPFGENNMIQTNVSFTDNGVKKFFPSGAGSFVFPVGSGGKYTPVNVIVSQNSSTSAYLIAKPADEIHPSIQEDSEAPDPEIVDADNVLQYYWVLTANGFTNLSAVIEMGYDPTNVEVTAPYTSADYITAKLLNDGTGNWYKYDDVSKFDETNKKLIFDLSNAVDVDVTGDYTAGVDGSTFNGAIPDQVPLYTSNGTGATLDWYTPSTWVHDLGLPDIPRGARVRILVGDRVQASANYISAYTSEINGTLDVGTTFGNRVGNVSGTGTLYTERGSLPAGYYESFFSASGGTVEFGGASNYSVLSNITQVNNIVFSGISDRELPNLNLIVLGNFTINGNDNTLNVINEFDEKLSVQGNSVFNSGTFDAGTGANAIVEFNGAAAQTISGTGSFTAANAFNHVILNNSNGLSLLSPAEIDGNLTMSGGLITTTTANLLTIDNTSESAILGYSSTRYIDGPLRKNILSAGDFLFPLGDAGRSGQVEVLSTTLAGSQYWQTEYFYRNPHGSYDITSVTAPIQTVSNNEYWIIKGSVGDQSHVKIRWDAQSQLPAATTPRSLLHIVEWDGSAWGSVGNTVTDNSISDGRIQTNSKVALDEHVFTIGSEDNTPLPTAGFISGDTTICIGGAADLVVSLTGTPNWEIDVTIDGGAITTYTVNSSPYTLNPAVSTEGTYSIIAVRDDVGGTPTTGAPFGNDVTLSVSPIPTAYNITGGGSYCAGEAGVVVGLSDSDIGVTYELFIDAGATGSTVAGDGSAISFGFQTTDGNYTIEAQDVSGNCTQTMTGDVDVIINSLPVATLTITAGLDAICTGSNTELSVTVTAGATPFDFTVSNSTNSDSFTNEISPYTFNPAIAPVWVDDGSPDTDYTYSITSITDNNGCTSTNIGSETVTVYKIPETGPQYHISNSWGN